MVSETVNNYLQLYLFARNNVKKKIKFFVGAVAVQ